MTENLTPARISALRKVAEGSVEYEASSATYWYDRTPAARWGFRTLADLGRMGLIQRPQGSARGLVTLTEKGRETLDAIPAS